MSPASLGALDEAYRVLKIAGGFCVSNFNNRRRALGSMPCMKSYLFQVIPRVGEVVTGDRDAYAVGLLCRTGYSFKGRPAFSVGY